MKKILLFVLAASLTMFAQGKGGGGARGGGPPAGPGPSGAGVDHRPDTGARPASTGKREDHVNHNDQQPLKDSQINSGSFRMLEKKSGMTEDQLKAMYASSGAKNYGQFVSAVVVSKNLGLDTQSVLDGLKTKSLGQTLKDLGVSEDAAKSEIKKANAEIKITKKAEADARKAAAKNKA